MSVSISGAGSISGLDQGFNVTTGSVGVGTTNPGANLEVHSDAIPRINSVFQGSKHFGMSVGGSGGGFVLTDGHFMTVNHQPYADRGTDNNLTERLRITSDGKMGLGTQTPADKLSISGGSLGIYNTGNSHGNVYFYKDGTPKGWLKYRGDNDTLLIGNVTDSIHVLSSGNVAIGHNSAPTKLGIRGTSASTDATVQIVGNGVSTLLLGQDAAGGVIRGQGGSNQLKFKVGGSGDDAAATGGVEALRITSDGKIGVAVASPQQKLDVVGSAHTVAVFRPDTNTTSTYGDASVVNNLVNLRMPYGSNPGSANNNGARWGIKFQGRNDGAGYGTDTSKSASIYAVSEDATAGYNRQVGLAFYTSGFDANQTERLRITSAGLVGIGTNAPSGKLNIFGSDSQLLNLVQDSGDLQIRLNDRGAGSAYIKVPDNTGGSLAFWTGGSERYRITSTGRMGLGTNDPNALLEVRDSENTTQGNAQIRISKGVGSGAAPATITRANTYLHLGGTEWGSGANGKYLIGLGYTNDEVGSGIPAYMGYTETSTGGYTKGDLIFGTRGNTTGTDNPTERFRITSSGAVNISTPSSSVAAGLLNLPNGSRLSSGVTPRGTYATANGGVVDMARYEMISRCITAFPNYNSAICAINGAPLYINDSRDTWDRYYALPNYLLGTLTHDCINNTSFNITLACTMTVFMGRSAGWNAVSTSGWNLIESNTSIGPFSSSTRLYVKTLGAGTHNLDNDSAMYFFSL